MPVLPRTIIMLGLLLFSATFQQAAQANELPQALTILQQADSDADADQSSTATAWRRVTSASLNDLATVLAALDGATPAGVNWLSSAIDSMLQRELDSGRTPADQFLSDFILDQERGAVVRETALDLLLVQNEDAARLVSNQLLGDVVARMRRPAVTALLQRAEQMTDSDEQVATYERAFEAALDEDHVVACTVALRKAGRPVDHIRKFGFLMHWQIIGPFDYADGEGFDQAFPPESLTLEN